MVLAHPDWLVEQRPRDLVASQGFWLQTKMEAAEYDRVASRSGNEICTNSQP